MNEKIGSQVTLLKCGNKGSVMWDVTPIPHWLRKRLNMDIYRLSLLYGLGPKGYPSFMSGVSTYMPTVQPHTRVLPASPRPGQAGFGYVYDLAKPYLFREN